VSPAAPVRVPRGGLHGDEPPKRTPPKQHTCSESDRRERHLGTALPQAQQERRPGSESLADLQRHPRGQSPERTVGNHQRLQEQRAFDFAGGEAGGGVEEPQRRPEVVQRETRPAEGDATPLREDPAGDERLDEEVVAVRAHQEAIREGQIARRQARDLDTHPDLPQHRSNPVAETHQQSEHLQLGLVRQDEHDQRLQSGGQRDPLRQRRTKSTPPLKTLPQLLIVRLQHMLGSHNEEDFRNVLSKVVAEMNYAPVPVPKPVKSGIFSNRNQLFETIEVSRDRAYLEGI
jgi:hypothetical protein